MIPDPSKEQPVETGQPVVWQNELASPPARRYRVILFYMLLLFGIASFSLLTILVEVTPSFAVDLQITRAVQAIDSPFFAGLMHLISWPGFLPQSVIITVLVALVLYAYDLRWESVCALVGSFFSGASNEWVKGIIERPRPSADLVDVFRVLTSYSFPSGHVMFYTILFGFAWYVIYTVLKPSWVRTLFLILLGLLISLVGTSRIYLGQHWASDVLGGYLLGALILTGLILLHRWGSARFFVRQPATSHKSAGHDQV